MSNKPIRKAMRARQARTGESYNAARQAVIKEHRAGQGRQVPSAQRSLVLDAIAASAAAPHLSALNQIGKLAAAPHLSAAHDQVSEFLKAQRQPQAPDE